MNTNSHIDDETLGRWLSGELKGDALKEFETSDYFHTYQAISDYSSQIKDLEYDSNLEFKKLKSKLDPTQKKGKVIKFNWVKSLSIAASIALVFGLGFSYFNTNTANTVVATIHTETKTIELPNHSIIDLNIASTLTYNEQEWNDERVVTLKGEAYFDVTKGSRFVVNTEHGNIEVLGTEFNIRNRNNFTEIVCYEGKVKVNDLKGNKVILTPGMFAKIKNGTLVSEWNPTITNDAEWKNGFSSFQEVDLSSVFEEVENQYNVKIECKADIVNRLYVGAFPHDNIDQALELVCGPMQLKYTITKKGIVIEN